MINSNFLILQPIGLKFYRVVINRLAFDNMYKKYKFSFKSLCHSLPCRAYEAKVVIRSRKLTKRQIICQSANYLSESESESELFTGDTSKDNHSPGPVFREVSP